MKRMLLLPIALLMSVVSFGKSIDLGTYQMMGKEYEVYYTDGYYFIGVMGETSYDKVHLVLSTEEKYIEFLAALRLTREKYAEWIDVAKNNNVRSLFKDFPVEFPTVIIGWKGAEQHYDFNKSVKMCFSIKELEDGSVGYNAICGGTATSLSNKYITQKWYMMFFCLEEIDTLLEALSPANVHKAMNGNSEAEALFQ